MKPPKERPPEPFAGDPTPSSSAVLAGIRVIELGAFQVGPLAARWLEQAGAEVIKIEGMPGGDPSRGVSGRLLMGRFVDTYNWGFEHLNRNKKSIGLKLDDHRARGIMHRLVAKADVFVSNLRAPTLAKWGVDYESLAGINPHLVYARGTGFGPKGAEAQKPALDLLGQARSGWLGLLGNPEEIYLLGGVAPCDRVAALQLAYGILLALIAREHSGRGQLVDASLLGAGIYLNESELQYALDGSESAPVFNRSGVPNPLRNLYRTKDGRWLVLNMSQSDRYWPAFCTAIGREDLEHDPRFHANAARADARAELIAILDQVFAAKTKEEWEHELSRHNLIWSAVKNMAETAEDVQSTENGYLVDRPYEDQGNVRIVGPLIGLSETKLAVGERAPELGQHTEGVLLDIAGYTWDELIDLKDAGVVI